MQLSHSEQHKSLCTLETKDPRWGKEAWEAMVQDSITDHIDTAWGKFIAFKFYLSYGHHFCRDCSLICYLPKVLKVKIFSNNEGQKTPVMPAAIDFSYMEMSSWIFAQSLHRFLTSKGGHFFNFLQESLEFSDCLLDWRKLGKTCKIVLHPVGKFSFCIQHTSSNPYPTER